MLDTIPAAGAATPDVGSRAHADWMDAAQRAGHDLEGFDPGADLAVRLIWAAAHGFLIGAVLSRFSSKLQHSTDAQVSECVRAAAARKIYVPPEFICVDEGVSGRKSKRDGLERAEAILKLKLVQVLLVYKVSRLFRAVSKGYEFLNENVVEQGLRAISVSQGIDTADAKTWKQLCYLYGLMDEMLLTTIADHVRSGISGLFRDGYVVGALTVGYRRVEDPTARPTNRGHARTRPAVDPDAAKLIKEHFQLIRDGLPIQQGWREWVRADGPCDRRSRSGHMTYTAYRRLLSNPRYTGRWAFGRKRNRWNSKKDYNQQIDQPETEVITVQSEELRIVSDELYFAVQERLAVHKTPRRGPRRRKEVRLWDIVTGCFFCAACSSTDKPVRMYQAGANGRGMRCKRGTICPACTIVNREEAVRSVCDKLSELFQQDADLIATTIVAAQAIDATGHDGLREQQAQLDRQIGTLTRRIKDLIDVSGTGSDEDRAELKASIRAAQQQRAAHQAERSRLEKRIEGDCDPITPERVRALLSDLSSLLTEAVGGFADSMVVQRAATVFELLVGGRIDVHVETRPGRKRTNVRGSFAPALLQTVQQRISGALGDNSKSSPPVEVWLRKPPQKDRLAATVHQLIDIERHSFRSATTVLQAQGHRINSGVVWQIHQRYWEMQGVPAPVMPYNNARPRKERDTQA